MRMAGGNDGLRGARKPQQRGSQLCVQNRNLTKVRRGRGSHQVPGVRAWGVRGGASSLGHPGQRQEGGRARSQLWAAVPLRENRPKWVQPSQDDWRITLEVTQMILFFPQRKNKKGPRGCWQFSL